MNTSTRLASLTANSEVLIEESGEFKQTGLGARAAVGPGRGGQVASGRAVCLEVMVTVTRPSTFVLWPVRD